MSTEQHRRGNFEERLLEELRSLVVARTSSAPEQPRATRRAWVASRPRRRLVVAGSIAAVLAVATGAGVPLFAGGASPAYAVSTNDDGTVTVVIKSLSDAAGLQANLRDAGIHAVVQYLPPGKACKQPWFTPAPPGNESPMMGGVEHLSDDSTRFTISDNLPADETLVIMTQVGPEPNGSEAEGPTSLAIALAKGPVKECEMVDAPAGVLPIGPPPQGGGQLHTDRRPDFGLSTSKAGVVAPSHANNPVSN